MIGKAAKAIASVVARTRPRTRPGVPFVPVDAKEQRPTEVAAGEHLRRFAVTVGAPRDAGYVLGPAVGPSRFQVRVEIYYPASNDRDTDAQMVGQDAADLVFALNEPAAPSEGVDVQTFKPSAQLRPIQGRDGTSRGSILTLFGDLELTP